MQFWRRVGETRGADVDVDVWGMDDCKGSCLAVRVSLCVMRVASMRENE